MHFLRKFECDFDFGNQRQNSVRYPLEMDFELNRKQTLIAPADIHEDSSTQHNQASALPVAIIIRQNIYCLLKQNF